MQISDASGAIPPFPGPSTMTTRPSGEEERTERVPDQELEENDRKINSKDDQGTKIDIMA